MESIIVAALALAGTLAGTYRVKDGVPDALIQCTWGPAVRRPWCRRESRSAKL